MMLQPPVACLAAVLTLAATAPAFAQGTEAQRAACGGDAFRLCASAMPNADKVAACLRREKERLSPACRGVFEAAEGGGGNGGPAAGKPAPAATATQAVNPEPTPNKGAPQIAEAKRHPQNVSAASRPVADARVKPARPAQAPTRRAVDTRTAAPRPSTIKRAGIRQAAVRRHRDRREQIDMAQARYWMKRVTGLSLGDFAGLVPD